MKKGVVFTPQALSSMGKALEETTEILGISRDEAKRRDVARFIIRLAQEGDSLDCDSLDAATLRDKTVAALGGVAYCALPRIPQSSNACAGAEGTAKRWILRCGETGAL